MGLDPSITYETDHAHRYPKARYISADDDETDLPYAQENVKNLFHKAKYVRIKKRSTPVTTPYQIAYRIIDPKELAGETYLFRNGCGYWFRLEKQVFRKCYLLYNVKC